MATTLTWETGGRSVAVTLDAAPSQGFEITAEPTEHAVERGADITDHVRPGPDTITLEGVITNTPMVDDGSNPSRGDVRAVPLGDGRSVNVFAWDAPFDRVRTVDTLLRDLVAAGALVTLATGLRPEVTDLVVTRYRADRSATIGDAVQVSLELRRVRLVSVRRVEIPAPAQRRGQRQGQRGAQPAGQTADRRSALARALDSARTLL
jgi:hypothetical protein